MIKIKETDLITASKKGIDEFLQVFTDAYLQAIDSTLNEKTMPLLTGNQHALLSHRFFSEEIREGGFVQLIQNGYGAYIFQSPFVCSAQKTSRNSFTKQKKFTMPTKRRWNAKPPKRSLRRCTLILRFLTS